MKTGSLGRYQLTAATSQGHLRATAGLSRRGIGTAVAGIRARDQFDHGSHLAKVPLKSVALSRRPHLGAARRL